MRDCAAYGEVTESQLQRVDQVGEGGGREEPHIYDVATVAPDGGNLDYENCS